MVSRLPTSWLFLVLVKRASTLATAAVTCKRTCRRVSWTKSLAAYPLTRRPGSHPTQLGRNTSEKTRYGTNTLTVWTSPKPSSTIRRRTDSSLQLLDLMTPISSPILY
ncbi:hypothetical protein DFH09DRAFT_1365719, partial [Mycena vulgaris]